MKTNDSRALPVDTAMTILDQTRETLKKVTSIIGALTDAVFLCQNEIQRENSIIEPLFIDPDSIVYTKAPEIINTFYASVREGTMALYNAALIWPSIIENGQIRSIESGCTTKKTVHVFFEDRAIMVRTPMLWSRARRDIILNGREYKKKEATLFREDLMSEIKEHPDFQQLDLSLFKQYILHFLYVYSPRSVRTGKVVDNDTHETKYIQDAITMFLPGGDNPFSCSIYLSAYISRLIPEGTYITVTPAHDGIKSAEEIELFWTSKLDQMN